MPDASLERRLSAYLPHFERERIADWATPPADPQRHTTSGAALFADLVGFTPLTRHLTASGSAGPERLSALLDATFGRMVALIEAAGGDVVLFAGDALLAVWPDGGAADSGPGDTRDAAGPVIRAAAAGRAILDALDGVQPEAGVELRLRASVASGDFDLLRVGGHNGRWRFLAAGSAIDQLDAVDAAGEAGQVLLSPEAAGRVSDRGAGSLTGRSLPGGFFAVETIDAPPLPARQPAVPALDALRLQVPRVVAHWLEAGQDDWLGEFRQLSVMFVAIPGGAAAPLEVLDAGIRAAQEVLERFRGSVYSLAADDKGLTLIAAFGLPPLAGADTAVRAVGAALQVHDGLAARGFDAQIGVTTGRVYCGAYGGAERRHYAIVGSPMNLAARLMVAADDGVLCDAATRKAAGDRAAFDELEPIQLKGFEDPVPVFRPTALRRRSLFSASTRIVGRQPERARLQTVIDRAIAGESDGLLIEAEAGLGKSTLLAAFAADAEERDVRVLSGGGDALRASTLYFGWRSVLEALLPENEAERAAAVEAALAPDARELAWIPVLSAIVPIGREENDTTRDMTAEVRAFAIEELVVSLIGHAARESPTILLLEDVHWFDSRSQALLLAAHRRLPGVPIVVSARPFDGPTPPDLAAFAAADATDILRLQPLSADDVEELVALALGVERVPRELVDFVRRHAECHPFHSTEMVRALRDRGALEVTGGACRIRTSSGRLDDVEAPASIQEVVLARVDQLEAGQQVVLKTASVVGREFDEAMLRNLFADAETAVRLPGELEVLEQRELIEPVEETDGRFRFHHAIIEDVVYGALPFAQRRHIHRRVAEWYESEDAMDRAGRAPLLAHHWDKAAVPERALVHLEAAGVEAADAFSNYEAVRFLSRAVELQAAGLDVEPPRRAEWERHLGEARIRLSQYDRADAHLQRALGSGGLRVHRSATSLLPALLFHVGVQATHRLLPFVRVGSRRIHERRAHGARVYKRVAEVAYFENDKLRLLHATLAALNMAEDCGAVLEQVNGFGSLAIVADLGGMSGLADRYMARAIDVAEASERPSVIGRGHMLALIRAITRGDWEQAAHSAERGQEMFTALGDNHRWETCVATHGYAFLARGEFDRADEQYELAAVSARFGSPQTQTWARAGQLAAQLDGGEPTDFTVAEVERLLHAEDQSRTEQLTCSGLLARAYLRRGETERAREAAARTIEWLGGEAPAVYYPLWSICGAADVLFAEAKAEGGEPPEDLVALTKLMRAHGKMFPICVPRARYYEGRLAALRGRSERAARLWAEGAEAARDLGMAYDEALLAGAATVRPDGSDRPRPSGRPERSG